MHIIHIDDGKCGAVHYILCAHVLAELFDESGLACPHIAVEGKDTTRSSLQQHIGGLHLLSLRIEQEKPLFGGYFYCISDHSREKYAILRGLFLPENARKALNLF